MDTEAKKFLGRLWADDASTNRQTPEEAGINRGEGWDLNYEQVGTGKYPERRVFNQLVRELQGAFQEHMLYGVPRWASDVDFPRFAFVQDGGRIFRANVATGPSTNNAERPSVESGDIWRRL